MLCSFLLLSAAASSDLVSQILPASLQSLALPRVDGALATWSIGNDNNPPSGETASIQKTWDAFRISSTVDQIMNNAADNLAVSAKQSGAWLHALPISSLGLRMDDPQIEFPWVFAWELLCVVLTPVNTVGLKLTTLPSMDEERGTSSPTYCHQ